MQDSIDAASADGADVIIAVGHLGTDPSSAPWRSYDVIENTTGLDAFIDGHSHSIIEGETVKNKNGEDVILTSTGTKLQNIGKMTITPEGKITTELVSGYTDMDPDTDTYIKSIQAKLMDKLNEVMIDNQVLIDYICDSLGGVIGDEYADPYGSGRITIDSFNPDTGDGSMLPGLVLAVCLLSMPVLLKEKSDFT